METFIWVVVLAVIAGISLRLAGVTRKAPDDVEFLGVCQGIGEHCKQAPGNYRVIFLLLLAFVGWKVFVGYLLIALIIPEREKAVTTDGEPKVETSVYQRGG